MVAVEHLSWGAGRVTAVLRAARSTASLVGLAALAGDIRVDGRLA